MPGEIVVCNDEMTSVQTLERTALEHPTLPSQVRLIEYAYIRLVTFK